MALTWRHFNAYGTFHQACVGTHDVDPVYPVLHRLSRNLGLTADQRTAAVFLHVAYYHLGSAVTALGLYLDGVPIGDLPQLPCGTERRGHRSPPRLSAHLRGLEVWLGDHPAGAVAEHVHGDPAADFNRLVKALGDIPGNGRWATYKTAEMLWKVADFPLAADRLEIVGSSGPAAGLRILAPGRVPSEELAAELIADLEARTGWPATPEQVETTLCDFHSLAYGGYYVGHDIDQMAAQLVSAGSGPMVRAAWEARAEVLPRNYLGELADPPWFKPDPQRKRTFRETGRVVLR